MDNKPQNFVERFHLIIPDEVQSQITGLRVTEVGIGAGPSAMATHKKKYAAYVELDNALQYLAKFFSRYPVRIAHIKFENNDLLLFNWTRFVNFRHGTPKTLKSEITEETTISEAIEILKQRAEDIANSTEEAKFHQENPSWSKLFRKSYKPYRDALMRYEEACELYEWLNGKNPENAHLTIKEAFTALSEQERLSLFNKRVNTEVACIFDEHLKAWWINRY